MQGHPLGSEAPCSPHVCAPSATPFGQNQPTQGCPPQPPCRWPPSENLDALSANRRAAWSWAGIESFSLQTTKLNKYGRVNARATFGAGVAVRGPSEACGRVDYKGACQSTCLCESEDTYIAPRPSASRLPHSLGALIKAIPVFTASVKPAQHRAHFGLLLQLKPCEPLRG